MTNPRAERRGKRNAPRVIYLQIGPDGDLFDELNWADPDGVSWCEEKIFDSDIKYVRAYRAKPKRTKR